MAHMGSLLLFSPPNTYPKYLQNINLIYFLIFAVLVNVLVSYFVFAMIKFYRNCNTKLHEKLNKYVSLKPEMLTRFNVNDVNSKKRLNINDQISKFPFDYWMDISVF